MADSHSVGEAFLRYLNAGLSVIPIGYRSKRPAFDQLPTDPETGRPTFLPFTKRRATPAQAQKWADAGAYPGIVAGAVSEHSTQYDFDDAPFCEWLLTNDQALAFLQTTWTVRSGSGKVHVYLRDDGTHKAPGEIKLGNRKLGDVRVAGQYTVAPPSIHEDTGDPYVTIFGSPETIRRVANTYATISTELVALLGTPEEEPSTDVAVRKPAGPNEITPAAPPHIKQKILAKLSHEARLTPKVKRAIREGVIPGDGEWVELDRSKISSDVVAALMEVGWGINLINLVLASFPIGSLVYRNSARRGSYGRAWLVHTWREKTKLFEGRKAAVLVAKGMNFDVKSGNCTVWPDGNIWTLWVQAPTTEPEGKQITIKTDDFKTYSGWVSTCMKFLHTWPMMAGGHVGTNYHLFATAVMNTCVVEKPPEDATEEGRLKGLIIELADKDIFTRTPEHRGQWTLGWRDGHYVYLSPASLATRLSTAIKSPPTDPEVLKAMAELGAVWVVAHYGEQLEQTELMWRLPQHIVTGEPSRNGTS